MGYTHYWSFLTPLKGETAKVEKEYKKAIKECATIAREYYLKNGGLSGYSAHTEPGRYGGLKINGKGDESHEDFTMREHYKENLEWSNSNFCKTARKPYDVVVTACLIVLANRLPDYITVSSDGYREEWIEGLQLAKEVTGVAYAIPETIKNSPKPKLRLVRGEK